MEIYSEFYKKITRNAVYSLCLSIASTLLLFSGSILFARVLGVHDYGIYIYTSSWISLLGIPGSIGTREFCIKETAIISINDKNKLKYFIQWCTRTVIVTSFFTILIASFLAWKLSIWETENHMLTYYTAVPLVFIFSQIGIRYGALRGLDKVALAQIPESFFKPLLHIALFCVAWLLGVKLTAWNTMLLAVVASGTALLIIQYFFTNHGMDNSSDLGNTIIAVDKSQKKLWFISTIPFMFLSGLYLLNSQIAIIMIGSLRSTEETAVFKIANYGAGFISFVFMAVNTAIAPSIAKLWKTNKQTELQYLIKKSIRLTFIASLPLAVFLFCLSDWLLKLYGPAFVQGAYAMRLLCIAQLINIGMGSVGFILNMCNKEKLTVIVGVVSTTVNILLNLILIPRLGINGAAISATVSIVLWNLILLICVRKKTGLRPSIFNF